MTRKPTNPIVTSGLIIPSVPKCDQPSSHVQATTRYILRAHQLLMGVSGCVLLSAGMLRI